MDTERIIKADSARELGHKVVFDLVDFEQHCADRWTETQEKITEYLSEAKTKAESWGNEARKSGFQAGYEEGMKTAEAEIQKRADQQAKQEIQRGLQSCVQTLEQTSQAMAEAQEEWLTRWEAAAVGLSVSIAEQILRAELSSRPQIRQERIREILEIVSSEQQLVVKVHPDDARYLDSLGTGSGLEKRMEVRSVAELALGDCLVESEYGALDGRIATQLEHIQAELAPQEETPGDEL